MKHILFILNVPSFYKINLLNRLSEYYKVTGIFLGTTDQVMKGDVFKNTKFSPIILSGDDMDRKLKGFKRVPRLLKHIKQFNPDYIVYCGWDNIDMVFASFLTPKSKNCIICESSIFESSLSGFKGMLKRIFVTRYSKAFPSGKPHLELLDRLHFQGKSFLTGSVGINTHFGQPNLSNGEIKPFKFIFIGRLIELKNIDFLVDIFNETGKDLTIVGDGPLMSQLKNKAKRNINFKGNVSRDSIDSLIHEHHCLILPSKSEPWGLVVEEALQCGVPVIASDRVGSSVDLIKEFDSGIIFKLNDKGELIRALNEIESRYNFYRNNALRIDFSRREKEYLNAFLTAFV